MGLLKTIVGYLLFALLATLLFLYVLFPQETVKAYVDDRLAGIDASFSISASDIRPALPLALDLKGIDLKHHGDKLIHIDQARVSPVLATLLKAQKRFNWSATLAGGSVEGRLFIEGVQTMGTVRTEADLSSIRLERISAVNDLPRFKLTGPLSGHLTHEGSRPPFGQTKGILSVPGLRITLETAFFGIEEIPLDQTEADFSLDGPTLRLKALTFNGPLMEGKINGTIAIEAPLGRSRLRLNGNVKPRPELFARLPDTLPQTILNPRLAGTRGLNFRVLGTIDNPKLSMR